MTGYEVVIAAPRTIRISEREYEEPAEDRVLVRVVQSAISSGTEMLAYRGELPDKMPLDANIAGMGNKPSYPMKYGYCATGEVAACGPGVSDEWLGKRVFGFHPHASYFEASVDGLIELPDGLSYDDAMFLPNMETAVSFLMDGRPMLGERVLVLGAGVVGQLTTALLSTTRLDTLAICDPVQRRRTWATVMGADEVYHPDQLTEQNKAKYDLVYELSGNPAAPTLALDHARYAGRIVLGSWYGSKHVPLDLGGRFHRAKLSIYGSQVSEVDPALSGKWDKKRRLEVAMNLLNEIRPACMISHAFDVRRAAAAYDLLDRGAPDAMQVVFTY